MATEKAASFLSPLIGGGSPERPAATVQSITVYPVKSCRGISVPQAVITSTGFRWDRQWMVVNTKGRAVTQRVEPTLALVEINMPPEAFAAEDWQPASHSHMVIRAPGKDPLKIPLAADAALRTTFDVVGVWDWSGSAYDEGDEAAEWFSAYLGKPSRLVRFKEASVTRPTDPDYAQGYKVMFSDAFPILIVSQGSLDALNKVLKEPVRMNRFRPNILVDGCHPYSEDLWKTVKINNLTFMGVRLRFCCKVPTVDQENGTPGIEPNETLRTYRSGEVLRPSHTQKRQVYFGQNLVCKESLSANGKGRIIKVGASVYVLQSFSSTDEAPA
ncbi:unnamed protein product [Urochloa humidicola]